MAADLYAFPTLALVDQNGNALPAWYQLWSRWNTQINTASSGGGLGSVTSVSVTTANGFAGSVATSTTTPAITLQTTITGLLKGNGSAMSAAVAGTDYVAPASI